MRRWAVSLTFEARAQLLAITDQRIQTIIRECIKSLEYEPEIRGKPMRNELAGYRSIRAVGQRYRIIYKVDRERVTVLVVSLGIRKEGDKKDAYELAKKLMRQGLLDLE
jgi:mRNA interferase RelE/StbE